MKYELQRSYCCCLRSCQRSHTQRDEEIREKEQADGEFYEAEDGEDPEEGGLRGLPMHKGWL